MWARACKCLVFGPGFGPSPDKGPEPEAGCWFGLVSGTRCPQQGGQVRAAPQLGEQWSGTRSRTCGAGELRHEAVASGERRKQPDQQRRLTLVTHDDLPMLQAQASKLRATIKRRTACAGANAEGDNVAAIVSHYSTVLAEIEEQIGQLKDASPLEDTHAPAAAAEPAPAVPASGQAAAGKKHVFLGIEEEEPSNPSADSAECRGAPLPTLLRSRAGDSVSTACSSSGEPQA